MQFRGNDNACLADSSSIYKAKKLLLSLPTLDDFIKCTQIMKPVLYNIQDVASSISSFTN
jgi:hypothetical protein